VNVDTGEFRALTEQVGALGRKVSALTGRTTVMGNHLNRLDGLVENGLGLLCRTVLHQADQLGEARGAEGQAAPRTGRPALRLVRGDGDSRA